MELWRERADSWHLVRSLGVATAVCAGYCLSRMVGLAVLGPEDPLFQVLFGTGVTLLMAMVLLVVVSSSITSLNYARRTEDLRELAYRAGPTGLRGCSVSSGKPTGPCTTPRLKGATGRWPGSAVRGPGQLSCPAARGGVTG